MQQILSGHGMWMWCVSNNSQVISAADQAQVELATPTIVVHSKQVSPHYAFRGWLTKTYFLNKANSPKQTTINEQNGEASSCESCGFPCK